MGRFVGTDVDEIIRLRLESLKNVKICKKLLVEKCRESGIEISENILNEKSLGLSSVIESALGFLNEPSKELNARILNRYYALLQLTIAEEVASIKNESTLNDVQKHTEFGHGLAVVNNLDDANQSVDNLFCYILKRGHFSQYLKHLNQTNTDTILNERRIGRTDIDTNRNKLISLSDLLRTIPELIVIVEEYLDKPPLSFVILHERTIDVNDGDKITTIKTPVKSNSINIHYFENLGTIFSNFKNSVSTYGGENYIEFELEHREKIWWNAVNHYSSQCCSNGVYIPPLLGKIDNPILINFMLLYTLSIVVRYLPNFWYQITKGESSHISNLIDYYIAMFDHCIPKIMLERILEKKISVETRGSFFS